MNEKEIILKVENIDKTYKSVFGKNKTKVIEKFSFEVYKDEILGIVGSSGSGKSTIIKAILKITPIDKGKIYFYDSDIHNLDRKQNLEYKKKVQYIPQRPESSFDPRITIEKSIKETFYILFKGKNINYKEQLDDLMLKFSLNKDLLSRYPHQISGGEIQRFAISRALLINPEILILDEATSMLDVSTQAKIIKVLKNIKSEKKITYLLISHDNILVNKICDRIINLQKK